MPFESVVEKLFTYHGHDMQLAAERRIHNHGRVGVHQGAEAEGGEAEPGDRLRAGRAETRLLLPDGTYSHTLLRAMSMSSCSPCRDRVIDDDPHAGMRRS
jgi:hypothetical protein